MEQNKLQMRTEVRNNIPNTDTAMGRDISKWLVKMGERGGGSQDQWRWSWQLWTGRTCYLPKNETSTVIRYDSATRSVHEKNIPLFVRVRLQ